MVKHWTRMDDKHLEKESRKDKNKDPVWLVS